MHAGQPLCIPEFAVLYAAGADVNLYTASNNSPNPGDGSVGGWPSGRASSALTVGTSGTVVLTPIAGGPNVTLYCVAGYWYWFKAKAMKAAGTSALNINIYWGQ